MKREPGCFGGKFARAANNASFSHTMNNPPVCGLWSEESFENLSQFWDQRLVEGEEFLDVAFERGAVQRVQIELGFF